MERKVALVTGAGRGLGRGIAEELAASGWSVIVNYHSDAEAAATTAAACREKAPYRDQQFLIVKADIAKAEDRERLVEESWGLSGTLDALVNNAGIAPASRVDLLEAGEESFENLMRTNLQGPYFLTQAVAKRMIADRDSGSEAGARGPKTVVFIGSISAEMASISRGEYCVSKAALSMAARLWSARLAGEGISVFELRPGIMATDMTSGVREKYDDLIARGLVPAARWGSPEDAGRAVRSLLSGDWAYATGSIIDLGGGMHIPRL